MGTEQVQQHYHTHRLISILVLSYHVVCFHIIFTYLYASYVGFTPDKNIAGYILLP